MRRRRERGVALGDRVEVALRSDVHPGADDVPIDEHRVPQRREAASSVPVAFEQDLYELTRPPGVWSKVEARLCRDLREFIEIVENLRRRSWRQHSYVLKTDRRRQRQLANVQGGARRPSKASEEVTNVAIHGTDRANVPEQFRRRFSLVGFHDLRGHLVE